MTRLLPTVLSTKTLALAELCASRLDGEIYSVDECFATVDQSETPEVRGAAMLAFFGSTVAAAGRSALWIRGYLSSPPIVHTVCLDREARVRLPPSPRVELREAMLSSDDVGLVGGMPTLTAERVIFDLLLDERFSRASRSLTQLILVDGRVDRSRLRDRVLGARNLPGKRRAIRRLSAIGGLGQGADRAAPVSVPTDIGTALVSEDRQLAAVVTRR
jgi:hypothetical protein